MESNNESYEQTRPLDSGARAAGETAQSDAHAETWGVDEIEVLTGCLEKYSEAAPLDRPSDLRKFLPNAGSTAEHFVLIELIKFDMATSCEQGAIRQIETYVDAFPDYLSMDSVPIDLVMEEIQLRREHGDIPDHDEYLSRFPQFETVLGPLLGVSAVATKAVKNRSAAPELEVGAQVDDFDILQRLGSGAFAHVYLARQISMQRLVALKVSRGTGDEPQALSQLDHVNIVRVYDQRESNDTKLNLLYMQFQPGGTLAEVVKQVRNCKPNDRSGRLLMESVDMKLLATAQAVPDRSNVRTWLENADWSMVVAWIGVQLAKALDSAHAQGVLHRDVKPANVLLSAEGVPKLADFNVSFAGAAGRAGAATSFGGSVGYMAPEHLRAISPTLLQDSLSGGVTEVSEKADIYALGILLWELWQGARPFDVSESPASWSDAVQQQLDGRYQTLVEPVRRRTASERALESTLRYALQPELDDRPSTGAEVAGRLKLALHPEVATLFDPDESSWQYRIRRWSPWAIPSIVLLVPNLFVMAFNYFYNQAALLTKHADITGLESYFNNLALVVSASLLAVGLCFLISLTRAFVAAIRRAESGEPADEKSVRSIVHLGQNAALIGGSLWVAGGVIYPIALWFRFPELPTAELIRFFFSLLICGGVASIYPFFGMTTLGSLVYFPQLVRNSMQDSHFDVRARRLLTQTERFWLAAVAIPLMGVALLVFSDTREKSVVLTAVAATLVGSFLALRAFSIIRKCWSQMSSVLSEHAASIPGLQADD